jgi:hypothetical protein
MSRSARTLGALVLCAALYPAALSASVLWFGDRSGLHQIDTTTNTIVADVVFEPPVSIAVNAADGSVFVLTQLRLARLSAQGAIQLAIPVGDLGNGIGAPRSLAMNSNDGSVWAGFENRLLHIDGLGAVGASLDVAADDSRWRRTAVSGC